MNGVTILWNSRTCKNQLPLAVRIVSLYGDERHPKFAYILPFVHQMGLLPHQHQCRIGLGGRENCHIIQTINASRPGERGPCLAAPFGPTISTAPNALSSYLICYLPRVNDNQAWSRYHRDHSNRSYCSLSQFYRSNNIDFTPVSFPVLHRVVFYALPSQRYQRQISARTGHCPAATGLSQQKVESPTNPIR